MNAPLPAPMFNEQAFREELDADNVIERSKDALSGASDYLDEQFRAGRPAGELLQLRAQFVDTLLSELWDRCALAPRRADPGGCRWLRPQ